MYLVSGLYIPCSLYVLCTFVSFRFLSSLIYKATNASTCMLRLALLILCAAYMCGPKAA